MWDEKKIRIIDIADELGVSTATVSNVIHGKTKKISDATVRRVQEKLVERGYIPNMAATLLSQNNSRIVGVVVNSVCSTKPLKKSRTALDTRGERLRCFEFDEMAGI